MTCTTWGRGKDKKRVTSFLNKRSGTQFYYDWKPIMSIIDILHKNFQKDHTNSRRFPGFPGVVDTLCTQMAKNEMLTVALILHN